MADIDEARVRKIAELARLELTDEEVRRMAGELGRIVDYVGQLQELPLEGGAFVPGAAQHMPLRPDETAPCLDRETALAEAPQAEDGAFAVPAFVDEG